MNRQIGSLSDTDLRESLTASLALLKTLSNGMLNQPDVQQVIHRMLDPGDILETITELTAKDPELMRLVLRANTTFMVNVQGMAEMHAEMKRRDAAAAEN